MKSYLNVIRIDHLKCRRRVRDSQCPMLYNHFCVVRKSLCSFIQKTIFIFFSLTPFAFILSPLSDTLSWGYFRTSIATDCTRGINGSVWILKSTFPCTFNWYMQKLPMINCFYKSENEQKLFLFPKSIFFCAWSRWKIFHFPLGRENFSSLRWKIEFFSRCENYLKKHART